MTRRVLTIGLKKIASLGRDDSGAALVITLAVFFALFIVVSSVYAMGMTVGRRIELQNASDAAAYSAAVVQADGLSRMATINRAMSWTYVQMVRRQLDYITYRWLKLTYKNFSEDRKHAKDWFFHLLPCNKKHHKEGPGWWIGQGPNDRDTIRLNMGSNYMKADKLKDVVEKFGKQMGDGKGSSSSFESSSSVNYDFGGNFGPQNLTDVQKDMLDLYEKYSDTKSQDEIFTMWYTNNGGPQEPPKYVENTFGKMIENPQWTIWNNGRKNFVDNNKIDQDSYGDISSITCPFCKKPFVDSMNKPIDHTQCGPKEKQDESLSKASGSECPICKAPKNGGTHKYCEWGQGLGEQIQNDKKTIEMMNMALTAVNLNMMTGIKDTVRQILEFNLPKDNDGNVSSDFMYTVRVPVAADPYATAEGGDAALAGMYSPLYNTEEHETLFLNMADGAITDNLGQYFAGSAAENMLSSAMGDDGLIGKISSVLGGSAAPGLDQWMIRTYPDETKIANQVTVMPNGNSFHAPGISRSYKNANRDEGKSALTKTHRGNHILVLGDSLSKKGSDDLFNLAAIIEGLFNAIRDMADVSPSCQNTRDRFPDMCRKAKSSIALVSQYRWASAKWFCYFTVYTFGIAWHHPFIPLFFCDKHGYGSWFAWIPEQLKMLVHWDGKSRNDYRPCFMSIDKDFILKGHSRIYGDDRDLVNEQYVGTPARPWLLNEKYFAGDGTISVAVARKQRNPWQNLLHYFNDYDAKSQNVSNGLMSIFNINTDNYQWTVSSSRAAYRRRSDGWTGGDLRYDVKFDASAFPDALKINYADQATGDLKKLRVGCVCDDEDNMLRLKHAWNLCTPDWEATLLPVRYGTRHVGKYERWKGDGTPSWQTAGNSSQGIFDILSQQTWNSLDKNETQLKGVQIMKSVNHNGKKLGDYSFENLEKLKIY